MDRIETLQLASSETLPVVAVASCGGVDPKVVLFSAADKSFTQTGQFELPNTSYAFEISPDGQRLAAATKCGQLFCLDLTGKDPEHEESIGTFPPVVRLLWIGSSHVVVSCSNAQVFIVQVEEASIREISSADSPVCAFFSPAPDQLFGLAENGELIFWSEPFQRCSFLGKGPAPARPLATVNFFETPEDGRLAYPSANGELILRNIRGSYTCWPIGESKILSIAAIGETIIAFERGSYWAHVWRDGLDASPERIKALKSVLCAKSAPWSNEEIVLCQLNGSAGVYRLIEHGLEPVSRLPGESYRTFSVANVDEYERVMRVKRDILEGQYVDEAKDFARMRDAAGLERTISSLLDLESFDEATAHYVEGVRDELLDGFLLRRFAEFGPSPKSTPVSSRGLLALAELFVCAGLIDESISFLSRFKCSNETLAVLLESLKSLQENGIRLLAPNDCLGRLDSFWNAVGRPIHGDYILRSYNVALSQSTRIDLERISRKVKLVLAERGAETEFDIERTRVATFSQGKAKIEDALRVPIRFSDEQLGISLFLLLSSSHAVAGIECCVAGSVEARSKDDLAPSNREARDALQRALSNKELGAAVDAFRGNVLRPALWRICNEQQRN